MKKLKKGFTLIELMVVIAILGIFAAIVLASLSNAKNNGEDGKIKTTLKNIQSQGNLYYSNMGNFGITAGACNTVGSIFTDTTTNGFSRLITSAQGISTTVCGATSLAWSVSVQSKANAAQFICADSTGTMRTITEATPVSRIVCP